MSKTVSKFENITLDEIKIHFDIVCRHLEHRLKTDFGNNKQRINTEADFNLAVNILQRSLEQAQTLFGLLEQKNIDITSIAAIQRSLYESFLTFVYLFATNIFSNGSNGDSREQVEFKLKLHQYIGIKSYEYIKNKIEIDSQIPDFKAVNKIDKKYLKDFDAHLLQSSIRDKCGPRENLEAIFSGDAFIHSRSFLLKNVFEVAKERGLNTKFKAAYNYLSDYAHCGKLSLCEYAPREYEKDDSRTILSMAKLCLVITSQFFLEYCWYCKTIWDDPIEIDDNVKHPDREEHYDTVELLEYWINYFREEGYKRPHFKKRVIQNA